MLYASDNIGLKKLYASDNRHRYTQVIILDLKCYRVILDLKSYTQVIILDVIRK